jgi:hypothetical protein
MRVSNPVQSEAMPGQSPVVSVAPPSQVALVLRRWQRARGDTPRAFARLLGRHESEWSRVWRGQRTPSAGFYRAACAAAQAHGGPSAAVLERAWSRDVRARVRKAIAA